MACPIAVFCFNRPEHLRATLLSLKKCDRFDPGNVIVFCDGARTEQEKPAVEATRAVAREMLGEQAQYRYAERNLGLAASITGGVSDILQRHDQIIVVEDDLLLAPFFLAYMEDALQIFENSQDVLQISGHMFDVPEFKAKNTALLLPLTTTWGWATWRRAWAHYDPNASGWEQVLSNSDLRKKFNFDGAYDYASMLRKRVEGKRDSWGIYWYWSVFRRNGLVLFPPHALVVNGGFDGTGTNGLGRFRNFARRGEHEWPDSITIPEPSVGVKVSDVIAVRNSLRRQNGGILGKMVDFLKRLIG